MLPNHFLDAPHVSLTGTRLLQSSTNHKIDIRVNINTSNKIEYLEQP